MDSSHLEIFRALDLSSNKYRRHTLSQHCIHNLRQYKCPQQDIMDNSQPHSTPSYALSTLASRLKDSRVPTAANAVPPRHRPRKHASSKATPSYALSTFASRRRAAVQQPFPFLRLPAELRNRVYELALSSASRCIHLTDCKTRHQTFSNVRALALLAVSRQVQSEAADYYFGTGHFNITMKLRTVNLTDHGRRGTASLLTWLKTLKPAYLRHLSANPNICLRVDLSLMREPWPQDRQRYEVKLWRYAGLGPLQSWHYSSQFQSMSRPAGCIYTPWSDVDFVGIEQSVPQACPSRVGPLVKMAVDVAKAVQRLISHSEHEARMERRL